MAGILLHEFAADFHLLIDKPFQEFSSDQAYDIPYAHNPEWFSIVPPSESN